MTHGAEDMDEASDACPPGGIASTEWLGGSLPERLRACAADDDYTRRDGTPGTTVRAAAMRDAADWIERLRVALTVSNTWLYGHPNADGQAERRHLNDELLTPNV